MNYKRCKLISDKLTKKNMQMFISTWSSHKYAKWYNYILKLSKLDCIVNILKLPNCKIIADKRIYIIK